MKGRRRQRPGVRMLGTRSAQNLTQFAPRPETFLRRPGTPPHPATRNTHTRRAVPRRRPGPPHGPRGAEGPDRADRRVPGPQNSCQTPVAWPESGARPQTQPGAATVRAGCGEGGALRPELRARRYLPPPAGSSARPRPAPPRPSGVPELRPTGRAAQPLRARLPPRAHSPAFRALPGRSHVALAGTEAPCWRRPGASAGPLRTPGHPHRAASTVPRAVPRAGARGRRGPGGKDQRESPRHL